MLLLSLTVGTWVKAPGLKHAGRIVGFVAGDDGQWRIVVAHRIEGGEGELKRDYAAAELTIVPGERNMVLEACATALLARRGFVFAGHPSAGTIAYNRSMEALEDCRAVIAALVDSLSQDMIDAARDAEEGKPDWRFYRRLDLVAMARGRTRRTIVVALKRALWRPERI
jgi:hypothetical protein